MQKIIPHLWFNQEAEEAAAFYTSVFGGSVKNTTRYPDAGEEIHKQKPGSVLTVEFEIGGMNFLALNGGPHFTFTPAISFMVHFSSKEEVDQAWTRLSEGGKALMELAEYPFSPYYGWVQDAYGLSWQLFFSADMPQQKIVPSLLFVGAQAGKAEEAIKHYTSLFPNGSIGEIARYGKDQAPDIEGTIMYADFVLSDMKLAAMDSAHEHNFAFNEAVSLLIECMDQAEIDYYWDGLSAVKEAEQCGWLKDKYGVSWQVAPQGMEKMLNDPDKAKVNSAMEALLKMKKLDIAALERAFNNPPRL